MKKAALIIAIIFLATGCNAIALQNFNKAKLSGMTGQNIRMVLTNRQNTHKDEKQTKKSVIDMLKEADANFKSIYEKECELDEAEKIAPAIMIAAPIIATGGQLLFNWYMTKKIKEVEDLKKGSIKTFSGRVAIKSEQFHNCDCAILARFPATGMITESKTKEIIKSGLISIIKFEKQEDGRGFVIRPRYVKAFDALAITGIKEVVDKKEIPYPINVSIAISVKAIGTKHDSKLPALFSIGEGVVSVPNIALGENFTPYSCTDECPASELIPLPDLNENTISVSMSVTEAGDVGFDIDQSKVELEAIKAALGPAIKETIAGVLKEND